MMKVGLCDELFKKAYFWCIPQYVANDNFKLRRINNAD